MYGKPFQKSPVKRQTPSLDLPGFAFWNPTMEELAGMDSTELVNHIMQTEDKLFESTCLKKLGLVERKGLDGQAMLYPIEKTQKKLETFEQRALVDRLYKPKKLPDPFLHMNPRAKKEIQKNMKLENEVQLTHRKHALRSSSQNVTRRDKSYLNTARTTTKTITRPESEDEN